MTKYICKQLSLTKCETICYFSGISLKKSGGAMGQDEHTAMGQDDHMMILLIKCRVNSFNDANYK